MIQREEKPDEKSLHKALCPYKKFPSYELYLVTFCCFYFFFIFPDRVSELARFLSQHENKTKQRKNKEQKKKIVLKKEGSVKKKVYSSAKKENNNKTKKNTTTEFLKQRR